MSLVAHQFGPLLIQKQTIPQKKALILSKLFEAGEFEGVALLRGLHAHLPQKEIENKVNLME